MTRNDYPAAARANARWAIYYNKMLFMAGQKKAGTAVGWRRAIQLSKGLPISLETIKRTYSFLSRAKFYDSNRITRGKIAYNLWGGDPMYIWTKKILNK